VHIPLLMRLPQVIPAGAVVKAPVDTQDWPPGLGRDASRESTRSPNDWTWIASGLGRSAQDLERRMATDAAA